MATKRAADLVAGDRIDLTRLWTRERDTFLHIYAAATLGTVHSIDRSPVGNIAISMTDAPARAFVPADYTFTVAD